MTTTPPTRSRANTPPTPLHGPKFDTYEPYEPRRSTRQANRGITLSSMNGLHSHAGITKQINRKGTQSLPRKNTHHTTLSQVLSPPSSPATPRASKRRDNEDLHVLNPEGQVETDDSDADMLEQLPSMRRGVTSFPNMLPTPIKTPRKRDVRYEKLNSTARVLFPGRALTPEDRMPRKGRKNKKPISFSLDSPSPGNDISIFTDSKDRIPEVQEAEENPFISQQTSQTSRSAMNGRIKHGMSEEIDRAVENGEGMVYTFRGKKIFRKFSDVVEEQGGPEELEDDALLHRRAGEAAQRPLTRSSIKPRLLFPPKPSSPNVNQSDEEALTDIEHGIVPETDTDGEDDYETSDLQEGGYYGRMKSGERLPNGPKRVSPSQTMRSLLTETPPRKHFPTPELDISNVFERASTPISQQTRLATPPRTVRKNKPRGKKSTGDLSPLVPEAEFLPFPATRRLNERPAGPFDEWSRTKPHTRSVSGKRAGEAMSGVSAKRTRSGG